MTFEKLKINGCFLIKNFVASDERGDFVKTFNDASFRKLGLQTFFAESYYSMSHKNVIRGMHFQLPPFDHEKLVYVSKGKILDVVVDLRKESKTYRQYLTITLEAFGDSIYIPKGCAHGFLSLSDDSTVVYNVSTGYNPESDAGILWNSFGFKWPIETPILSHRDSIFQPLNLFKSPF